VTLDQSSEDRSVSETRIKVGQLSGVERIHDVVMVGHPLQQNRLRHRVYVTLGHCYVSDRLSGTHSRQVPEVLGSNSVQVVDSEDLEEDSHPGFSLLVGEHSLNSLRLESVILGEKLCELEIVSQTE